MNDEVAFNMWAPQPGQPGRPGPSVAGQAPVPSRRRPWRIVYWVTFGLLCAAVAGLFGGVFLTLGIARAASSSMADAIQPGDLVYFERGASGVVRGDVVMVQAPGDDGLLIRRVIGLPGDRVACCGSAGRVTVDGKALVEDYLPPGIAPSLANFGVTLGPGQVWVMGDNRAIALDSRSYGPLAMSDIVGRVIRVTGSHGGTSVRTPATFTADGLAPDDHRFPLPYLLLLLALIAVLAVVVQGTVGTIRWAVRRRRRQRELRKLDAVGA